MPIDNPITKREGCALKNEIQSFEPVENRVPPYWPPYWFCNCYVVGSTAGAPMRLIWVTDIHLNFVNEDGANAFAQAIRNQAPQVLLVGGDIAEAHDVEHWLRWLVKAVEVPVYFVLGNHDYYRGSIAGVRETVRALCSVVDGLTWLSEQGPISLTEQTALIGHGCWGDGRLGDFLRSSVMLNDYVLIRELSGSIPMQRLEQLHRLGDEAAAHLRTSLEAALKSHQHVLALTHVPPFREAC
ncbi:MAG TPA: hypothetical protein EYN66_17785, partial [Myxococcales bacterium]|nr:hypothetical protein [Myxococcales bacterium]